jgi:hypothetical protein
MDPGLRFWLRYVDDRGGLTERAPDGTLVVLPAPVAAELDLPDELVVTSDPETAREDGVVLLATGHPALLHAADSALAEGDVGVVSVAASSKPAPTAAALEERLRDQVSVEHGRIDVTGDPTRIDRPIVRVGALVTYTVSAENAFQERLECWVDAPASCRLDSDAVARLHRAPRSDAVTTLHSAAVETITTAVGEAHRILDGAAERRRSSLSAQASDAHRRELARARDYYADALRTLQRRQANADPHRAGLLAARADATRAELARRLAEIDEKYQPSHEIRPFRLHAVLVPGWRVPVDVRRGPRRYPSTFDWLPALGSFAPHRCPACGASAPLSASKTRLGCTDCHPR